MKKIAFFPQKIDGKKKKCRRSQTNRNQFFESKTMKQIINWLKRNEINKNEWRFTIIWN